MKKTFILALSLILISCTPVAKINGQLSGSEETFEGEIKDYRNRSGRITFKTSEEVECTSRFNRPNRQKVAKGFLRCSDGRTGPYSFNNTVGIGESGFGYGSLNGVSFQFDMEN